MTLESKYISVINAAKNAALTNLKVVEQDGILYVSGETLSSESKDAVWNALGVLDPTYAATDINIDVQVVGLQPGTRLFVITEKSNLNIRQEAHTEGAIVGKAAKGETVALVEQTSNEWWRVRTDNGEEGYAYSRYLKA